MGNMSSICKAADVTACQLPLLLHW